MQQGQGSELFRVQAKTKEKWVYQQPRLLLHATNIYLSTEKASNMLTCVLPCGRVWQSLHTSQITSCPCPKVS